MVDDDVRNIFALTSVLEQQQMGVGRREREEAFENLERTPEIDTVLMDIMMAPEDRLRRRRARSAPNRAAERSRSSPATAKAMKATASSPSRLGASDDIPKPVDMAQLLSLLRVWLYA